MAAIGDVPAGSRGVGLRRERQGALKTGGIMAQPVILILH
jgi:hypothetical protein